MAGESTLMEVSFDNVALNTAAAPNLVAVVDATNSNVNTSAATVAPTSGTPVPLGVFKDKAKTDSAGNVVKNSGFNVRVHGIVRAISSGTDASGVIAAGSYVAPSVSTQGRVKAQAASGTATKVPILGIALTGAAAGGDQLLVLLTPGVMV